MGMNCGYGCSKPGILKIITVVLGLIIWIWMGTVIHNSKYFEGTDATDDKNKKSGMTREELCEELTKGVNGGKDPNILDKSDNEAVAKAKAPCPKTGLVWTAAGVAFFSFVGSIIALLLLLCVELNKNGLFNQIDFIGHFVAGFLNVVGAVLTFAYVGLVFGKFPSCKDSDDKCSEDREEQFGVINFAILGGLIFVNGIIYYVLGVVIQKAKT